jgi:hypothetical protein
LQQQKEGPMTAQSIDLLSLIADDRQVVTYRPRWNTITGGVTATLFLQQVVFWWVRAGRRPFYKFARPCSHRLCRDGDSWEEELAMQRREFETARSRVSARTHGEIDSDSLVSFWVDAQRVTWYALNESLLLQHLADLYPPSGAAVQLTLPDQLMDESHSTTNGRSVHQPQAELMDESYITSNGRNVQYLMDEPYISTDGRNVHLLYSENKITQQRSPETTTTAAAAPEPPAADAADAADPPTPTPESPPDPDPVSPILDWIGFDDTLTPKERAALAQADLLAWAYWVHLKRAEPHSRIANPVGLVRAQWRRGQRPRADLLDLARTWLYTLDDDARARLLGRLEWTHDLDGYDPATPLEDEFPDVPIATASAVYVATGGHLAPPSLSPAAVILPPAPEDPRAPSPTSPLTSDNDPLWHEALAELQYQMTTATFDKLLRGTNAHQTADGLTVHVRNAAAVEWLSSRLHPIIQRAVNSVAGRPLPVRYQESHS